jgi:hypothetical protein
MRRFLPAVVVIAATLTSAPALALNLTLGDVTAQNLGSYGFTATNSVLSRDSGATDDLYQMFGYVGNGSDVIAVDATSFSVLSGITQIGAGVAQSTITLNATGAAALGLAAGAVSITNVFRLIDDTTAADQDGLAWEFSITNHTASTVTLEFYAYLDLDLGGGADFADDAATADGSAMWITDTSGSAVSPFVWRAAGPGAGHFEMGGYPSLQLALNGMTSAQNLADTGSFGPGDFTGSFQYSLSIAPGATVSYAPSGVPEPRASLLLGAALAALACRRSAPRKTSASLANP